MSRGIRRWVNLAVITLFIVVIDQASKQIVLNSMELYESVQPIPALETVFQFTRTFNTGAAFGVLNQAGDIFLLIAIIVIGIMLYVYPRVPEYAPLTRFGMGLVCGGAIGNAIDRVRHGHVVDFIHYRIPDVISNVSNLADHAIVLGVILIFIDSWRVERIEKRLVAEQDEQDAQAEHDNAENTEKLAENIADARQSQATKTDDGV